jgi:hypothetical protein
MMPASKQVIEKESAMDMNRWQPGIKEQVGQQALQTINETELNPIPDRSFFPFSPDMISSDGQAIPLLSLGHEGRSEALNLTSPLVRPLDFASTPTLLHSFMNILGGVNQNTMEEL